MRALIYVSIIHTQTDMGSMSDLLRDRYIQRYGEDKWLEHVNKIDTLWDSIEKRLDTLNLCYKDVKIYQDGLPNCGKEGDIVSEVARRGSKNHRLIIKLLDKGAQLIGTEDPELLIEEYKTVSEALSRRQETDKGIIDKDKNMAENCLSMRDRYISRRIDETLKEGETGILFIGIMHKVNESLPEDVKIEVMEYWSDEVKKTVLTGQTI